MLKMAIVALCTVCALAASAEGACELKKDHGPKLDPVVVAVFNPKIAKALELTEEQKEKLARLKENKVVVKALRQQISQGMQKQAEALKSGDVDMAALDKIVDEVWSARRELAKIQIRRLVEVKSILTCGQIKKAREMFKCGKSKKGCACGGGSCEGGACKKTE